MAAHRHARAECRLDIRLCHRGPRLCHLEVAQRAASRSLAPLRPRRCCRHSPWRSAVAHRLSGSFACVDRFAAHPFQCVQLSAPKVATAGRGSIGDGLVGLASGIVGASTGLAGLPIIIWSTSQGWSKDEQRAVFQPVVVAIFAMNLLWFGGNGMVTKDVLQLFFMGLPAALLGTWLGLQLYGRLDEARFRQIVLLLLLLSGLTLLPAAFADGGKTHRAELFSLSPVPHL